MAKPPVQRASITDKRMARMNPFYNDLLRAQEHRRQNQLKNASTAQAHYVGSFREFILDVLPDYPFSTHTERLVALLQRVANGELRRLILQVPPRHYKSTTTSRLFTAYWLRRFPDQWVGLGSYGADLASGFSKDARTFYNESGGGIDRSSNAVGRWGTTGRGGIWTTGVDGGATGKGYNLGVVDDPVKDALQADSPAYRERLKNWWDSVIYTRREPGAAIVLIQTRWHQEDLIGYVLSKEEELIERGEEAQSDRWHVVDLAAIAPPANETASFPLTCTVEPDWRQPGEALDPLRVPLSELLKTKANLQSRWWEALYQQRPSAAGGSVLRKEWFCYYDETLPLPQFGRLIGSIDCNFKETETSDFVALLIWGQKTSGEDAGMWLLDVFNIRLAFTETVELVKRQAERWQWQELLVEDKANGSAVIDTLKRQAAGYAIREVNPLGGKVARANACALEFEQGRVWFPRQAKWLRGYEQQLVEFPTSVNDDMVDATTQAINYVLGSSIMRVSTARWGRGSDREQPRRFDDDQDTFQPSRFPTTPGFR
jgi:predicted phage terminase large subunit-like protein